MRALSSWVSEGPFALGAEKKVAEGQERRGKG